MRKPGIADRAEQKLACAAWMSTIIQMSVVLNKRFTFLLLLATAFALSSAFADSGTDSDTLTASAQRIVTIPMPAAPTLIGLDRGAQTLVGMHPESRTAIADGLLAKLYPQALELPTDVVGRGFMPNVEAVLNHQPDMVIQWGDRGSDLIMPLRSAGLTVTTMNYNGLESDVREWLRLFGRITARPDRAEELISLRDDVQGDLAQLQNLDDEDKPRVLYLLRALSGLQAAGADTFNDYSIQLAGGRNVAAELNGFKPVNREQILQWNPDVILLNSFEADLGAATITEDPLLGLTDAARGGRVFKLPVGGYRWDPPSHESPLGWLWLAETLHGLSGIVDLEAEVTRILFSIYGEEKAMQVLDLVLGHFALAAPTME